MTTKEEFPAGWTKTLRDLDWKSTISSEEFAWARAYELSLLRPWVRFPKDGEIFEALDNMEVDYVTHWRAPFTDGGKGKLRKGERVKVFVWSKQPEEIGYYAAPLDYECVEKGLIPEDVRGKPNYDGFSLSIRVDDLNKKFRLVG